MKSHRIFILLLLLGVLFVFFTMQKEFDEMGRWGLVGLALLLAIVWVLLGGSPKTPMPVAKSVPKQVVQQESEVEIPETVTQDPLDGASLRERKMAKVRASQEEEEQSMVAPEPDDDLEEIELIVEEVHVADEYVVESSPQSIEDANIAAAISDKRDRQDRIRARIEERRRGQMAEIRASTAKMWEDYSSGEDLVGLVQSEGHGHNVIDEPAQAEAGHVYGATLVRIDPSTILKLRVPLDTGFVPVDEEKTAAAGMPVALPDGLPSLADLGLPLPPPPGASGALAALKDEIAND